MVCRLAGVNEWQLVVVVVQSRPGSDAWRFGSVVTVVQGNTEGSMHLPPTTSGDIDNDNRSKSRSDQLHLQAACPEQRRYQRGATLLRRRRLLQCLLLLPPHPMLLLQRLRLYLRVVQ